MNRKRSSKLEKEARKRSRTQSQNIDLDRLIEERKEEKRKALKEKLQQKLKTIRDGRVSGVNLEPFPYGAFERLKSNNIWEDVLGYLSDPADFTNAYHTCPNFAEILEERRALVMLPKALSVFKAKVGPKNDSAPWREWRTVCLNARGVSKAWKEIAEFQLLHSNYSKEDFDWFPERNHPDMDWCVFEDEKSVDQAMSYLSGTSASPVVRNVRVVVVEPETFSLRLYGKLLEFFKIHGPSVGSFYFEVYYSWNAGDDYERLCDLLKCMPNLKALHLSPYETEDEIQDFQRRLNEHNFPALESLETFGCNTQINQSRLSQILSGCPNLKNLSFSSDQMITGEITETLKTLPLIRFGGDRNAIITPRLNPNRATWPLKYLTIKMRFDFENASVLFPALNKFGETLEHLEFWGNPIKMDAADVRLDLPRLKYFSLRTVTCSLKGIRDFALDDVLQLKTLERIRVLSVQDEEKDAKVKVKQHFVKGEMEKSNVWQCFQNLKEFRISRAEETFHRPTQTSL